MLTLNLLIDNFETHLKALVKGGILQQSTATWYHHQLAKLRPVVGRKVASEVRGHHVLGEIELTHHFSRAVKRLYAWAYDEGLIPENNFRKFPVPKAGERKRVLTSSEVARLVMAFPKRIRPFVILLNHTMARPGELRTLRWREVHLEARLIVRHEFKCKEKRKDGVKTRRIPLDQFSYRMLRSWAAKRTPHLDDYVFHNGDSSRPWTANQVRCAMRRARKKAGLESLTGEGVVLYTLRHTGATNATRNGVRDRLLADMLGHTSTNTTARYQHLEGEDLVRQIDQATRRTKPRLRIVG